MKERCIVIPAIKKNAVIPDQLVKKLAGITLIQRSLDTARACAAGDDIIVLTDSEEIGLICERNGVRCVRQPELRFHAWDIVAEMRDLLLGLGEIYRHAIILRPSCPLLTWVDVEDAWRKYLASQADSLITVRRVRQRLWRSRAEDAGQLLADVVTDAAQDYVVETRALIILDLELLCQGCGNGRVVPYFPGDRALEILGYQDWWICERLLARRHIVFVVAGFPAIGMGHVYRALMLAHEISAHKITFVCTRGSDLAVESVASRDYEVIRQGDEELATAVLGQRPDLVINDFLDTPLPYMQALRDADCRVINFEDTGPGADLAALVINALEDSRDSSQRLRCGPDYFCLRDEFLHATRNPFRKEVRTLLITFGGTDQHNATERIFNLLDEECTRRQIAIRIVAGPGYAHKQSLEKRLAASENPAVEFTWATNIMSRMMEGVDLAIASAGRTVYELAHMRIPGIVLATHAREARHGFARPENGFAYAGIMTETGDEHIGSLFSGFLADVDLRRQYWQRQDAISFAGNKERVIGLIADQLERTEQKNE